MHESCQLFVEVKGGLNLSLRRAFATLWAMLPTCELSYLGARRAQARKTKLKNEINKGREANRRCSRARSLRSVNFRRIRQLFKLVTGGRMFCVLEQSHRQKKKKSDNPSFWTTFSNLTLLFSGHCHCREIFHAMTDGQIFRRAEYIYSE